MTNTHSYVSLREIQRRTGISRPSLIKYVDEHWDTLVPYSARKNDQTSDLVWSEASIPIFQMLREKGVRKRGKK